jgi:uncharacterized protein YchJ
MVNERLKGHFLEIVDNQLEENDPPCTRETLDRLMASGYSETTAKEMIASIVVEEVYYVMKEEQTYDVEKYCEKLSKLHSNPQFVRQVEKVGRNEPCPCGSGKKYKKCCGK